MLLYEPKQNGVADISRALDIERQAWETADLLSVEEDEEEIFSVPMHSFDGSEVAPISVDESALPGVFEQGSSDEEFGFVVSALSEGQRRALRAALKGSFSECCRALGVMEENMRGEINEVSMEYIGDMILDSDFSVLEDYEAEIEMILNRKEKIS